MHRQKLHDTRQIKHRCQRMALMLNIILVGQEQARTYISTEMPTKTNIKTSKRLKRVSVQPYKHNTKEQSTGEERQFFATLSSPHLHRGESGCTIKMKSFDLTFLPEWFLWWHFNNIAGFRATAVRTSISNNLRTRFITRPVDWHKEAESAHINRTQVTYLGSMWKLLNVYQLVMTWRYSKALLYGQLTLLTWAWCLPLYGHWFCPPPPQQSEVLADSIRVLQYTPY